ncbi:DEK protein [Oesophagostomum dentatum]|uniref:DEK protein n=1 Tax=Oesophagostomum dentatum TaxID=61180 RepID=A0A0B1TED9_OESDE|nr:DEK protein [Oesophagostomum dentatum]
MALLQNTSDNIPVVDNKQDTEVIEKMESPTKQEAAPASEEKNEEVTPMETDDAVEKKDEQVADKEGAKDSENPPKEQASVEESGKKESPTKKEEKKSSPKESPAKKEEKKVPPKESPTKESPVKKDNKKKENQENVEATEQADEEEEEGETEQKKGIFDLPLEVEGKRERHKVERITYSTPTVKKSASLKMGDGVPLGEIAYIDDQLRRHSADELQYVYRLIYGHIGKASMVRKEIRKFTGFAFEENSPEFKHKVTYLNKLTIEQLKVIKKVLGLDTGGNTKEAIVTSIMVFMMKTVDHKRKVAGAKKRKSTAKTPSGKRPRKSKGSDENNPSEKELEKVIEELLATFDLAQVSMKQMCQAVIERFPGTNIGNRVDYLKSKIKQCLSTK